VATLKEYLHNHRETLTSFAQRVGKPVSSIHRYAKGETMPGPETMRQIVWATGGEVQPNDFYLTDTSGGAAL